jgi:uncharacterized glyoxalase superfamily protein PhnB
VKVPSGTERMRSFIETQDLDRSKRFYATLGFEQVLDAEVAIFNVASGGLIVTRHTGHHTLNSNLMMQVMVDDLDAWWAHIKSLDLAREFGVPPPRPPALQPWGLRIAYVVDPSGVLWHFAERRPDTIQDR